MVRTSCCENNSVKRGVWTAEEDAKISSFVTKHGSDNWTSVPKKTGLKRCGKSCRLRWTNYLKPDPKHDNFTPQEEELIIKLHAAIGSRWSIIAQQLPGRTDNDVKSYWNSKVKKKLSQMGIDPVTHKPFSKLIADYGNINGCQKGLKYSEPYQTLPQQGLRNTSGQPNQLPTSPFKLETKPIAKGASNFFDLKSETIPEDVCSTSSAQGAALQQVPFSWNDFLLEDAFAPHADSDSQEQEIVDGNKKEVTSQQAMCSDFEFSSSSEISFVEAMLGQENEMFLSFPHLLEEPSNY